MIVPSFATLKKTASAIRLNPESHIDEPKYIVQESQLSMLFNKCPSCSSSCNVEFKHRTTVLTVIQQCSAMSCQYYYKWQSQPTLHGSAPLDNTLPAALFASGISAVKFFRLFDTLGIKTCSESFNQSRVNKVVYPAVYHLWNTEQRTLLDHARKTGNRIVIGGDMRADSPGHCAKYGTYTCSDLSNNKIISIVVVQSNETGGSNLMEKEGFIRTINVLQKNQCKPDVIITDRHPQIIKYVREEHPSVIHHFDVWHVGKSLEKKLTASFNKLPQLSTWCKSIVNHLYWCAASTPINIPEPLKQNIILDKWKSVLNHVVNIHVHDHLEHHPRCLHDDIEEDDDTDWIEHGSPAFIRLQSIVLDKRFLKDVAMLSTQHQTSSIEAFHSLVLQFTPKLRSFSYHGILCRQLLAAIHYNENSSRKVELNEDGNPKLVASFPKKKHKSGKYSIRTKKKRAHHDYVQRLMSLSLSSESRLMAWRRNFQSSLPAPPHLNSTFYKPTYSELLTKYQKRFK